MSNTNVNMFANQAKQKEKEMAKVEEKAVQGTGFPKVKRQTFALSISDDDLRKLRMAAAHEGVSVAMYVHNLIKTIPAEDLRI